MTDTVRSTVEKESLDSARTERKSVVDEMIARRLRKSQDEYQKHLSKMSLDQLEGCHVIETICRQDPRCFNLLKYLWEGKKLECTYLDALRVSGGFAYATLWKNHIIDVEGDGADAMLTLKEDILIELQWFFRLHKLNPTFSSSRKSAAGSPQRKMNTSR